MHTCVYADQSLHGTTYEPLLVIFGLSFLLRNRETKRDDFVFYTNRLACLVIEYALSFLPFQVRLGREGGMGGRGGEGGRGVGGVGGRDGWREGEREGGRKGRRNDHAFCLVLRTMK